MISFSIISFQLFKEGCFKETAKDFRQTFLKYVVDREVMISKI